MQNVLECFEQMSTAVREQAARGLQGVAGKVL